MTSYGVLRGAFRPDDKVFSLRSYVRQAKRLTEDRARSVQHMQKALTEMNVRLDSVISNIMGKRPSFGRLCPANATVISWLHCGTAG